MFDIAYKFTHIYEDKFTKPFQSSINFAEKQLNKFARQTDFTVDSISKISTALDSVKRAKINIKANLNIPKIDTFPDKTFKVSSKVEEIKLPDIEDKTLKIKTIYEELSSISNLNLQNPADFTQKMQKTYEFRPEIALYREFIKDLDKLQSKFEPLGDVKIKPDDKELKKLEKENLPIEADIKPNTEELEKIEKQGINLNLFMANIDTGEAKEQLLSFSEGLFEATKYGLKKAELGKEIAKQVKELDGLVSMSEMSNAVVSALKVGIRGTEKELAQYAKEIQKFHELTGKSYEESAQLIYKLKDKFKLPSEEISRVIDEMAVLRKEFAITEDDLTEALSSVKNEFGYLMSAMDKTTRSKFTEGMLKWSAALEQMHISAKESFDLVNKALSGDENALKILAQGGISISEIQKALQEGDIETVATAYQNAIIKIGEKLKNASPMMRKQLMQAYGLSEEMANSFMEVANNAEELQKQTEKAFSLEIKGGEAQKQWEEATNPFTKGLQKFKNEITATVGDLIPMEIFDTLSGVGDLFFLYLGTKGLGKLLPFASDIGGKIKDKILGGITGKLSNIKPPKNIASNIVEKTSKIAKVADKTAKAGILSKGLGFLGKIPKVGLIGTLIGGGLTLAGALASNNEDKTTAVSKAVGGIGGSATGAMIGATIGSVVPVVGTAIGGILGSVVGGFLGEKVGGFLGGIFGKDEEEKKEPAKQILSKPESRGREETTKEEEIVNAIYSLQTQLLSINNNTASIQQLNTLIAQQIEIMKMIIKNQGGNLDENIFKGFKR